MSVITDSKVIISSLLKKLSKEENLLDTQSDKLRFKRMMAHLADAYLWLKEIEEVEKNKNYEK